MHARSLFLFSPLHTLVGCKFAILHQIHYRFTVWKALDFFLGLLFLSSPCSVAVIETAARSESEIGEGRVRLSLPVIGRHHH
jgi:hypothetical protein